MNRPGKARLALPLGRGFSHGLQDLLYRGLENQALLGHYPAIHLDREFATVPLYELDLQPRLFP